MFDWFAKISFYLSLSQQHTIRVWCKLRKQLRRVSLRVTCLMRAFLVEQVSKIFSGCSYVVFSYGPFSFIKLLICRFHDLFCHWVSIQKLILHRDGKINLHNAVFCFVKYDKKDKKYYKRFEGSCFSLGLERFGKQINKGLDLFRITIAEETALVIESAGKYARGRSFLCQQVTDMGRAEQLGLQHTVEYPHMYRPLPLHPQNSFPYQHIWCIPMYS